MIKYPLIILLSTFLILVVLFQEGGLCLASPTQTLDCQSCLLNAQLRYGQYLLPCEEFCTPD
ncbi:hypothetical protein DFA_03504 [Cavenderia fasciculata]|uniref:Uncharacterized protein n=1 Tax=Cavenderia fasciculata TaxID=261658 RepID=F4PHS2_CACFS|nr:uncharacterized protein DFA_03504 [Cavenderia fasciculata]EGG25256.1 hypothetical protein DFA_03504 [Cavenderia fasciculata]|eukprot:XP_004363107.1 hypothetical protein DFA_03504 [Cavenderia fasciculata]